MAIERTAFLTRFIVGVTALLLCILCAFRAWAAWPAYQAGYYADAGSWKRAIESYSLSLERYSGCGVCYGQRADARMALAERNDNPDELRLAGLDYEEASRRLPMVASYWIGRARAAVLGAGEDFHGSADWGDISAWLKKAVDLEPESGWAAYWQGTLLLAHSESLSEHEWLEAFDELRRAAAILPRGYLPGILNFLWEKFEKPDLLVRVTPENFRAYQVLLGFLEDQSLWGLRALVYDRFQSIRRDEYRMWNGRGETAFHLGRKREAFIFFRRAFWRDPDGLHARAGLLATLDFGNEKMNLDIEKTLHDILSETDPPTWDSPENMTPSLAPYFRYLRSPLLTGMFAWHEKHYDQAEELLLPLASEGGEARRFLAMTYDAQGKGRLLEALLGGLLDESRPDIRELLLLKRWRHTAERADVDQKIEQVRTRNPGTREWRYQGKMRSFLTEPSVTGMVVNLLPGKFKMALPLRWQGSGEGGYIIIRLGKEVLKSVFVRGDVWRPVVWEGISPGGHQWLNLERLDKNQGSLQLGSLRVLQPVDEDKEPADRG